MPKSTPQLDWCIVRLGEDHNWWVEEISNDVYWDVDGLSIIDPRQLTYITELLEPLNDYGFDTDIFEAAFFSLRIQKELGEGRIRLVRVKESILDTEEKLFALPDVVNDEIGAYADFLEHIIRLRVKFLNDVIEFEKKLTIDEVEEEIREDENNNFLEGRAVHVFHEIVTILEYVPAGYELDDDDKEPGMAVEEEEFPEIEETEEEEEKIKEDETMRWDDDEEEEEKTVLFADDDDTDFNSDDEEDEEDEFSEDFDEEEEDIIKEKTPAPGRRKKS